ncbi:MAG: hypothetical protein IJF17_04255 [Thermoguttaceae bacterium]|nr:hypothetical protein [Thermoguttaceae bacterium]MDO4424143.1 hypothetical protein [Planctomycetia bacterium]
MDRRTMLKTSALSMSAAVMGIQSVNAAENCSTPKGTNLVKRYPNEFFYDKNGKFLEDRAREAFYEMFKAYNYPLCDFVEKNIWFVDFGMGDFANTGMGGIIWLNREDYRYFSHDIYLLPGQMIPEHCHVPTEKAPAKMESWHVRYGSCFNWSEGDETVPAISKPSASQAATVNCKHCEFLQVGDIRNLGQLEKWHFLQGGPEGVIVTETASYHDFAGLRFSNPDAKL